MRIYLQALRNVGSRNCEIHLRIMDLKAKLDKVFSEFIRLRDSDENGYCKCISSGKIAFWTEMDCGHFINRKFMSLRFSEINCNAQSRYDNRYCEGNFEGYRMGLIKKHGEGIIEKLYAMKNEVNKISHSEYTIAIRHYTNEVQRLKKEKGL